MKCNIDLNVMIRYRGISGNISVDHLSNAVILVIVYSWFSIFLLDCGSPYMGQHFQVHVACHLQGHSLGGLRLLSCFVF